MKTYVLMIVTMVVLFVGCQKKQDMETTVIKANSMVCSSCAKTIENAVNHVDGVTSVSVDVKAKTVEVKYVPTQTNVGSIETAITNAGYDANDKKRNPDAYEKLDKCCKIDG